MAEKHAVIIAVEDYQDSKISSVQFAENDARALAESIKIHGYQGCNVKTLLSSAATKTRLESVLRTRFAAIEEDDQFVLYYAGHGFADGGRNYITCHDTVLTDLTATSIELQSMFGAIRKGKCKTVLLLLDCCHSGLRLEQCMRGLLSEMTDNEFEQFCSESAYHIVLASSENDEISYSSPKLKHGIWSYHVIEALSGRAKAALQRGRYLTISSLQNYLSLEVPRTLRHTLTGDRRQTPRSWGNLSREGILVDFTDIFASQEEASKSVLADMKRASLLGIVGGSVRSLTGFNKRFHHVPNDVSDTTRRFIQRVGKEEVSGVSENLFNALRTNFKYKRKELDLDEYEGRASIMTPDFNVNVTIDIDKEPGSYVLAVEVTDIRKYSALYTDAFSNVFDRQFDRVVFEFVSALDIKALVDKVENIDNEDLINVDYPADLSFCKVQIEGLNGVLNITSHEFSLVLQGKEPVKALLSECGKLPKLLTDHSVVGLLPGG